MLTTAKTTKGIKPPPDDFFSRGSVSESVAKTTPLQKMSLTTHINFWVKEALMISGKMLTN
jgi:hypothetical protein|tara:strand:+ start:23944 stop:24126 length:183 start_codon:yes stop_codon:yes gene_type:complete